MGLDQHNFADELDGPVFTGLRVLDLSGTVASGHVAQVLGDLGASVVLVEPPEGSVARESGSFSFLYRGAASTVADLAIEADRAMVRELIERADVVIDHLPPAAALDLGLRAETSRRIELHLSEFGEEFEEPSGSLDDDVVLARLGGLATFGAMAPRPGPSYVAVPFLSFSAAQLGLQAVLAALLERDRTGEGQQVSTSLLQGIVTHDIWSLNLRHITQQYPDAFRPAPHVEDGVPNSALVYRLLVGLTADGDWLQFSQTSRHLFEAFLGVLGLDWMLDHPDWEGLPITEDPDRRVELWNRMLVGVRASSTETWHEVFDRHPDVWAEEFRRGPEVLDHPQLRHDGRVRIAADGGAQLGPLFTVEAMQTAPTAPPAAPTLPAAPQLGSLDDPLGRWAPRDDRPSDESTVAAKAPLEGCTVLDLGMFFAGPMASALLADLGARVIKIEPLAGDPLRGLASFPEVGAIKAMQGKESIAVDLSRPEGRAIVLDLVDRADIVIQSFRAGAAARLGLDAEALLERNPQLVYVNAAGYGSDGPCGRRPAYAPTIGAASGIAWELVGATLPAEPGSLDLDGLKAESIRMVTAANTSFAQCDGLAALTNATAALAALYARRRDGRGRVIDTSMLHIAAHVNSAAVHGERSCTSGPDLLGPHPLRRLYEAEDGWLLVAARADQAEAFRKALDLQVGDELPTDDVEARFASAPTAVWLDALTGVGIRAVPVVDGPVEAVMLDDLGPAAGLLVEVEHPMLGPHPRLRPLVSFSRSRTTAAAGCELGQHTDTVLADIGRDAEERDRLRATGVVA